MGRSDCNDRILLTQCEMIRPIPSRRYRAIDADVVGAEAQDIHRWD